MAFGSTGAGQISFLAISGSGYVNSLSQNEIVLSLIDEPAKSVLRIIKVYGQNDPIASRFSMSHITIAIPTGDYFSVSLVSGTLNRLDIDSQKIELADLWNQVIAGDDFFELSELDDDIDVGPGKDIVYGNGGRDNASLGIGENFFDGGTGIDTVIYNGKIQNFIIQRINESWRINDQGGTIQDTVVNVERLRFSDAALALDLSGNAGQVYRVYKAAFNRDPMSGDKEGLGYWIGQMDRGMGALEVSARFVESNEFRTLYGTNPTNEQFLTKLYTNVLGRQPEASGFNWWLNELNTNPTKTKAKVLADFAESAENQTGVINLIGNGITYESWTG